MRNFSTPSDKPTTAADTMGELEFPDWSGSTRERPRVGWEVMHRLSEELLRSPCHKPQVRPDVSRRPAFEL
jgi:hypothetical protein